MSCNDAGSVVMTGIIKCSFTFEIRSAGPSTDPSTPIAERARYFW